MPNRFSLRQASFIGHALFRCHALLRLSAVVSSMLFRSLCALLLLACATFSVAADHAGGIDQVDKHFIIGGEPVFQQAVAPWIVALVYNSDAELVQRQFCGGSVIADRWVLTAAHCLFDRRGDLLQLSDLNVATNAADLGASNVPELLITNMIVHPDYVHNAANPHSDIALLELATSSGVEPITLSTKSSDKLVGLQATIMGWGAVDNDDPSQPKFPIQLHSVDVPVVSLGVCNAPVSYNGALYANQLCAGLEEGGRDSCVGDSGGPMIVNYEGQVQQVGIVSFGFGCALPNFYGVYTDIPYFIGWINQYVYVGEPEFEPELLAARTPTPTTTTYTDETVTAMPQSNSDVASMNWLLFALLGIGVIRRRSTW